MQSKLSPSSEPLTPCRDGKSVDVSPSRVGGRLLPNDGSDFNRLVHTCPQRALRPAIRGHLMTLGAFRGFRSRIPLDRTFAAARCTVGGFAASPGAVAGSVMPIGAEHGLGRCLMTANSSDRRSASTFLDLHGGMLDAEAL